MKTIALLAACLTALSTLATAQVSSSVLADASESSLIVRNTVGRTSSTQPADAFAPLTNEPFFPGGKQALETHLRNFDLYSSQARMLLIEGTVRVLFRVQPNGNLTDIQVVKSQGTLLDQAAVKVVATMPDWYPAHRSGVAVSSLVELPITFRID